MKQIFDTVLEDLPASAPRSTLDGKAPLWVSSQKGMLLGPNIVSTRQDIVTEFLDILLCKNLASFHSLGFFIVGNFATMYVVRDNKISVLFR